jgi:hypothetical protein
VGALPLEPLSQPYFALGIFWERVSGTIWLGLAQTMIFLFFATLVAKIIGMIHWCPPLFAFKNKALLKWSIYSCRVYIPHNPLSCLKYCSYNSKFSVVSVFLIDYFHSCSQVYIFSIFCIHYFYFICQIVCGRIVQIEVMKFISGCQTMGTYNWVSLVCHWEVSRHCFSFTFKLITCFKYLKDVITFPAAELEFWAPVRLRRTL